MTPKPAWWPTNPYPKDKFTMDRDRYPEIIPDPQLRTAISGMLGREFWEIASDMIWDRLQLVMKSGDLDEILADEILARYAVMKGKP